MRQPLVIANWKLNGDMKLANSMLSELAANAATAKVVICPPTVFVAALADRVAAKDVAVGAQNCSEHEQGAYTGETSAAMLKSVGCNYVIVGHSERRTLFGDTDAVIAAKVQAAQQAGLIAVLCIGETAAQRDGGTTMQVVREQLLTALKGADLSRLVIAYEPVWAIGTGRTASPEQAQQVHQEIRTLLREVNAEQAGKVQILYGGSVKADNAEILFTQPDIDGGLIGGASLDAGQFIAICNAVKG